MKTRMALLLLLIAVLFMNSSASARITPCWQVEPTTIAGGRYQLTMTGLQSDNSAEGGAYRLLGPLAPNLSGSGCCCTYLPLVQR